jgi:hypothetical protein
MNLTAEQQLEVSDFFTSYALSRRDDFGDDTTADICDKLAAVVFTNAVELGKTIRSEFDDYEEIFASMEDYSTTLATIVDAYWTDKLENV